MGASRILVATDFSEHSEAAGRLALSLATAHGAELSLLHVDQTPEGLSADGNGLTVRPELWRQYRESSQRLVAEGMAEQVAGLRRWAPAARIATTVDYGDVAAAIDRRARAWAADLIVMGSHGAGAHDRFLFGSVLTQLLPTAPCPVLITRAALRDRQVGEHGFLHPLVAIDYSHFAEPSARLAAELSAPTATIDLIHVWRPPLLFVTEGGPTLSDTDQRDLDAAAALALTRERDRLDAFRRRVLGAISARCEVEQGRVASVLLDHARARDCDLLVVGAHGPRPAGGIGSVTDRVLRHAPVPVLFVPETALGEARAERSGNHAVAPQVSARPRSRLGEA